MLFYWIYKIRHHWDTFAGSTSTYRKWPIEGLRIARKLWEGHMIHLYSFWQYVAVLLHHMPPLSATKHATFSDSAQMTSLLLEYNSYINIDVKPYISMSTEW